MLVPVLVVVDDSMLLVHAAGLERTEALRWPPRKGNQGKWPQGKWPHRWPRIHPPRPDHTPTRPGASQHKGLSHVSGGSAPPRKPMRAGPSQPAQHQGASGSSHPTCRSGPSLCDQWAPAGQRPMPSPPLLLGERGKDGHPPMLRDRLFTPKGGGGGWGTGEDQSPEGGPKEGWGAQGSPDPTQPIPQRTPLRVGDTHTHERARLLAYARLAHAERSSCRPGASALATSSPGPRPAPLHGQAAVSTPGDRGRDEVTGSRSARSGSASTGRPARPRGWRSRHRASPPIPRPHLSEETHPSGPGAAVSLRGPASGVTGRTGRQGALPLSPPGVPTRHPTSRAHSWGPRGPRTTRTGPPGPGEGGPAPEPPRHHPLGFSGLTGEGPEPLPASAVPPTGSHFLSEALPTQPLQHHPEATSFQGRLQHLPPGWELPGPGLLPHPETSAGKGEADVGSGPALPAPKVTQPGQGTEAGPGKENPAGGLTGATALGLSWMLSLALAGRGTMALLWWGPRSGLLGPHLIPPRTLGPLEGVGVQGWFQGQRRVRGASRGLPDTEPPAAEPQPRPGRFPGRTIELPRAQTGGAGAGSSASPSNESQVSSV